MKIRISCDDGCSSDIRLADLCAKYNIVCIFYWPVEWHTLANEHGYKPLSYTEAQDISRDFEVGSHTITHRHLTRIPEEEAKYEIEQSQYMLEDMFNVPVRKFAPPRGYTNDKLTEFTKIFYEKQRLTKEDGLVHVHPDSGANNNQDWVKLARSPATKELFMHSWELDKFDLWKDLEDFLRENPHT